MAHPRENANNDRLTLFYLYEKFIAENSTDQEHLTFIS